MTAAPASLPRYVRERPTGIYFGQRAAYWAQLPNSAMRKSKIRAAIEGGTKAYGIAFTFPVPTLAEMAGYAGFDVLHLDMEHGVFDWNDVEAMCRAGELHDMTCTARIPNTETDTILRAFDRGLMGILCPHVDNADQAARIADAARFGPTGSRSFGTSRGREYGMAGMSSPDYMASFNEQVTVAAQIETANAVETIDDILKVDGIDLIAFGSNDLAQSMGYPGYPNHPEVRAAEDRVRVATHAAGKLLTEDVESNINMVQWLPDQWAQWLDSAKGNS